MPTHSQNSLPDFLVIGAGKSGTTSVDNYLKQHPEIFISKVKEPNFFALEGQTFPKEDEDRGQFFHFPWSVTTISEYIRLFDGAQQNQLKGETSPMYLYHELAPANIKRYIPNVKLIAILRQPAERLYSRYMHLAQEKRLPSESFEDALDRKSVWWLRNDLVNEGFYFKHLSRYFKIFPKENILIILYEDLEKKRDEVIQAIFNFLGVDANVKIDTRPEFNPSGFAKNKLVDKLIGKNSNILSKFSKISPALYEQLKQNTFVSRHFNRLRKKNLTKPSFDKNLKQRITNEIYREDILNLQQLLGRDLKHWL